MKKLIKFIKKLYNNLPWVRRKAQTLRSVKYGIQSFFQGYYDEVPSAPYPMPVKDLGIFDIKIRKMKPELIIEVHLDRPGLFIGKGGKNYNALKAYLESFFSQPVNINIKEVRFWE